MKLFPCRLSTASLLLPASLALLLLTGCVKKSEYVALAKQKADLEAYMQTQLEESGRQLQQTQAELQVQQARLLELIHIQSTLQKRDQELKQTQEELKTLKAEFERFRTQRRSAMIGKKLPVVNLDNGRLLRDAEVTGVDSVQISFRHESGLAKVALAESTEDLRWEACYDPDEAKKAERERQLALVAQAEIRIAADKNVASASETMAQHAAANAAAAVQALRTRITAQRAQLNRDFEALRAANTSAMRNVSWNSAQPETSPFLNDLGTRPAILGISRLETQRDAIRASLAQLQSLKP